MPLPANPDTLYLIDGHAQIFRAYYAIRGGMNSPVTGEPTNAVFGFTGMLLKLLGNLRPRYALLAIDMPGKTFRDELYPQYKAQRAPMPDELRAQEPRIFEVTRLFGIPILGVAGAEADDVIATVTKRVLGDPGAAGVQVRVVSKDKDLEQLLCDRVTMFDIHTDQTVDVAALKAAKGITPGQVIDMLALMGDSVDNVPGVPGIGPKGAADLIGQFGSIEGIYEHLDQIKGQRRKNLEQSREQLALARRLVTLKDDVDIPFTLADARLTAPDGASLRQLFDRLGFRRYQADLDDLLGQSGAPRPVEMRPAEKQESRKQEPLPHGRGSSERADDGFADSLFAEAPALATTAQPALPAIASAPPPGFTTADAGEYRCITTQALLNEVAAALRGCHVFALDTETIGLGHRAALVGISLAWEVGKAVYIPVRSPHPADHLDTATVLGTLEPVFMDPALGKCGHNLNYDLFVLHHAGAEVRGVVFDSMIASHLLNQPAHGLDDLAASFLKHHMTQISELIGHSTGRGGPRQGTMDQVALPAITRYASDDAEVSLRLYHALQPMLEELGMRHLADDVEMPLVEVLVRMQSNGIRVDPAVLAEQKQALALRIDQLRDQIHEAAGMPFNIDSPKQLAEVLFDHLGLPKQKRTKTGLSTDIEVLEKLADLEGLTKSQAAVPILMVEYRQLSKLVSTYLDALRDAIDTKTGRVHAQFHQTGAATGRLSSSNPNLQNIPVRTEIGRQVRKAFVAEPGSLLISADYSQIELRILAHLSGDPGLIDAFAHDQDIHTAVAAQVFAVAPESVTREQRGHAKVINFGIVYGVTPYGLARRIEGLDTERAKALIADYKKRFAGIDAFLQQCVEQAIRQGYVTTMLGRRRPIREITSANGATRALGERLAINSVVQGSAADLIKLAMVNLHRRIEGEKLPMKLLLQIHDELVLEAPADAAPKMAEIVRTEMEQAATLRVPLQAEAGVGPDWLAAK